MPYRLLIIGLLACSLATAGCSGEPTIDDCPPGSDCSRAPRKSSGSTSKAKKVDPLEAMLEAADKLAAEGELRGAEQTYWQARSMAATEDDKDRVTIRAWERAGHLATESLLRDAAVKTCEGDELPTVYFLPDDPSLSSGAADETVGKLAKCLQDSGREVVLEAHVPGAIYSAEYAIALGERLAGAVQKKLIAKGVPEGRISTVSHGAERPVCERRSLDCFARSFRVDLSYR